MRVPKTAVDEERDFFTSQDGVGRSGYVGGMCFVFVTEGIKQPLQLFFRRRPGGTDFCHYLRTAFGCKSVGQKAIGSRRVF